MEFLESSGIQWNPIGRIFRNIVRDSQFSWWNNSIDSSRFQWIPKGCVWHSKVLRKSYSNPEHITIY